MSILLSPDRMIHFFFVARAAVFSFGLSYCAQAFLAGGLDWYQRHIPKPGTSFDLHCCEMKIKPFLALFGHLKSSTALLERSSVHKVSLWTLSLILWNASEHSCQNPCAFLFQNSPDMIEMSGFICGCVSCVFYLGSRFPQLHKNVSGFLALVYLTFYSSSVGFSLTLSPPQLKPPLRFCDWKKWGFFPIQRMPMRILENAGLWLLEKRLIDMEEEGIIYSWIYQRKSALCDCCHEQVASPLFFFQAIPSWE